MEKNSLFTYMITYLWSVIDILNYADIRNEKTKPQNPWLSANRECLQNPYALFRGTLILFTFLSHKSNSGTNFQAHICNRDFIYINIKPPSNSHYNWLLILYIKKLKPRGWKKQPMLNGRAWMELSVFLNLRLAFIFCHNL